MKSDIIIIGAGIVGLATALHLKKQNLDLKVVVLEKEDSIALHQTGNNSGVIHSGIYYKPGSLKAINCKKGYDGLIKFCDENNIKYDLCGKIIVATEENELNSLNNLYRRGVGHGLQGLKKINREEIREIEPHCAGIEGVWVPQTGIVDYKEVSKKYAELFIEMGGQIIYNHLVQGIFHHNSSSTVITGLGEFRAKLVINCAGLYSDKIAKLTNSSLDVQILPFRGEYYNLKKEKEYLVKSLIYPVPNPDFPFLGVHFTRGVNGRVEAGPNAVLAYKREGYTNCDVDLTELIEILKYRGFHKVAKKFWREGLYELYRSYSKSAFTKALQKLIPEITQNDLQVGGAGVRAQACNVNGELIDDFLIFESQSIINVCNAPSPAATSSYSIGENIALMALKKLS